MNLRAIPFKSQFVRKSPSSLLPNMLKDEVRTPYLVTQYLGMLTSSSNAALFAQKLLLQNKKINLVNHAMRG